MELSLCIGPLKRDIRFALSASATEHARVKKSYKVLSSQKTTVFKKGYMEYLYYQLHVSASALAIIRLALNLSSDYTICMVCSGGRTRSRFTIVGNMKIRT